MNFFKIIPEVICFPLKLPKVASCAYIKYFDLHICHHQGGTLIEYENKLRLLEIAQVPKENVDEFKSVSKFKIFNTNNLWMHMPTVARLTESGQMDMEVIVNNKVCVKSADRHWPGW